MLQFFTEMRNELTNTNSRKEKEEILKKYYEKDSKLYTIGFSYMYNYDQIYGVTFDKCQERSDLITLPASDDYKITDLLDSLNSRHITGHNAIAEVNTFVLCHEKYKEIISCFIDKDLKCGVGIPSINRHRKVVKTFDVALANKFDEKHLKKHEKWLISRKLDGVRCIAIIKDNDVKFYSRQGKEFFTLGVLREELLKSDIKEGVLDGELCLTDENGNEDFIGIIKQMRKKDHTIENPQYKVFDFLTIEEFESKKSDRDLYLRLGTLHARNIFKLDHVEILQQYEYNDDNLADMTTKAEENNWEGLMLRANTGYEGKRSNNLLKVKKMQDEEFKIVDVIYGKKPMLCGDNVMHEQDTLAAVVIDLGDGNKVQVGSGFSDYDRLAYYNKPELLVGKMITVQFFEKTVDKNGKPSLRFPVFKCIRENGE
jgi:DNA ligase-1